MLEKVPLLNLDQQSREQKVTVSISISGIYNWWKKRKEKKLKEQTYEWTISDHTFIEGRSVLGIGDENDSSEYTCSSNSFASADKINQRIDEAITRANGERYGEGEEGGRIDSCIRGDR